MQDDREFTTGLEKGAEIIDKQRSKGCPWENKNDLCQQRECTPMVLLEIVLKFGKGTWLCPKDPCARGTIHLCNFGKRMPSVPAMAHHHIIVLEPKQPPCEQKIIEARLREAFQFGPSLSKRHGSEEQRESGEDLAGLP